METSTKERSGFWSGTLFGTLLGAGSLLAYQYFSGILRQPRLISKEILSSGENQFENMEALAVFITSENLQSGIHSRVLAEGLNKKILHAGYRNFRESWARDFGFASYGLLAIEEFETVRDTLEAFFWHQSPTGQLPVKLHSISVVTRFFYSLFGREQPTEFMLKPKYISGHGAPSLDGQALLVIAACNYARETEDFEFLQKYWRQLKLAVHWLQLHRSNDEILLNQGSYADWADSIARRGNVLYTNIVYWKALFSMRMAATSLDLKQDAELYTEEAENLARKVHEHFWRSDLGYFVTSDRLDQLSSGGNLLAIAWGLASPAQAESILQVMEEAKMAQPVPTRVVHPPYPNYLVSAENILGGLANYHTTASWLWLGAWHAVALAESDQMERAQEILERITEVIVRDKQVNEVHGPDGEPLQSIWYKSESPLTWNAGMVLHAYKTIETKLGAKTNILSLLSEIAE